MPSFAVTGVFYFTGGAQRYKTRRGELEWDFSFIFIFISGTEEVESFFFFVFCFVRHSTLKRFSCYHNTRPNVEMTKIVQRYCRRHDNDCVALRYVTLPLVATDRKTIIKSSTKAINKLMRQQWDQPGSGLRAN